MNFHNSPDRLLIVHKSLQGKTRVEPISGVTIHGPPDYEYFLELTYKSKEGGILIDYGNPVAVIVAEVTPALEKAVAITNAKYGGRHYAMEIWKINPSGKPLNELCEAEIENRGQG